ncbi:hypothetical protein PSH79_19510 [Pseudomonas sp. FP2196]|uniref:dermonecrotic toxin domain-containing protein n=1 Tax=Pseudomonas sp. FP2196 TaxID=2954086 RepID=UPI002733AEBA|nr:DUF6543 domain-containing protein [Pseudomonas sp. FP2196]WLH34110.1 hypothetical protein PSH79_19510 [Pseudomonas sp. FP2196]
MTSPKTAPPNKISDVNKAELVDKLIAAKLANADTSKISEFRKTLEKAYPYQRYFDNFSAALEAPNDFCQRQLQDELQNKYNLRLNVKSLIKLQPRTSTSNASHTYNLLQAAMLNFTDNEVASHYFSDDSELLADAQDTPDDGRANVKITAQQFAAMSRTLDLGNQYQNHLSRTFNVGSVQLNAMRLAKLNMKLAAYTKYFSNDIHQSLWLMLTNLTRGLEDISNGDIFQNGPIQLYSVQLFRKYLVDAVLIVCRLTDQSTQDRYLLYVPNDTGPGFYHSHDEYNCRVSLTVNLLGESPLRKLFASRLNKTDQGFLTSQLSSISFKDDITFHPLKQKLFKYIANRPLDTFFTNVRQCAVPVADINQSIHDKRRENPELHQRWALSESLTDDFSKRLRTYAPDALISEVFTGVENWASSEKLKALHQLLDLKENPTSSADGEPTPSL